MIDPIDNLYLMELAGRWHVCRITMRPPRVIPFMSFRTEEEAAAYRLAKLAEKRKPRSSRT